MDKNSLVRPRIKLFELYPFDEDGDIHYMPYAGGSPVIGVYDGARLVIKLHLIPLTDVQQETLKKYGIVEARWRAEDLRIPPSFDIHYDPFNIKTASDRIYDLYEKDPVKFELRHLYSDVYINREEGVIKIIPNEEVNNGDMDS